MKRREVREVDGYQKALALLPPSLGVPLTLVSTPERVQDIHLRSGQAVSVGCGAEQWYVKASGELTADASRALRCRAEELQQITARVMQYSAYTHREELRRGFVTANGCRVGVAGTAVVENGEVVGYRSLSSLCIRVAREHIGCASSLANVLFENGIRSALICSEPAGGKTGLLRDLAREAAKRRFSVSVIDERGELSGFSSLDGCDVLYGTPKAEGIEQAVRCLSPQMVLLDELGNGAELRAVHDAAVRGVPTIATVHARSAANLKQRPALLSLLKNDVFEYTVLLCGRHAPGVVLSVQKTREWLYGDDRSGALDDSGGRVRHFGAPRLVATHRRLGVL
jgi:stage III sporulation protein AA